MKMNILKFSFPIKNILKYLNKNGRIVNYQSKHYSSFRNDSNVRPNGSILKKANVFALNKQNALLLSTNSNRRIYFSWKTFIISGGLIALFAGTMFYLKEEKLKKLEKQRKKMLGQTSLGGKFELINQDGKKFTSNDLEGKWVLLYFGFTHCPDVCPDELEKIVKAVDLIEANKEADSIQPVFITVDPERDSVAAVREYILEFSPKLIGLTGTQEQINQATRSYRVYYSAGPRDNDNDYIVDHTIITYLIDPEGKLVDYYGQTKTAEDVSQGTVKSMKKYRSLNQRLGFL